MMQFDFTQMEAADRYRVLTNFIGPRPIAWVSTRAAQGHNNAAPMSFFNVFSHDPALVVLGIQPRANGDEKDTMANIRRTGEFVVNMVDGDTAAPMVVSGVAFASDVDEIEFAGLTALPCTHIGASYIAQSPCAFECRVERIIDWPRRALVIGEVLHAHVHDRCLDAEGRYVNPETYHPLARLHADNYILADRQFELKRPEGLDHHEAAQIAARPPQQRA
jgi:flavin reductase (DIM6/NTAB) family NADH-FMN oxidoreductase RutF